MNQFIKLMITGRDTRINGLFALLFIAAVALGCTCGKDFGLSNTAANDERASNTSAPVNLDRDDDLDEDVDDADATSGNIPSDAQLQKLTRKTLLDFYDAISSGDFTDFHDGISKPFQKSASPEKFKEVFAQFVTAKPDFSEVRTTDATFGGPATIGKDGGYRALKVVGKYDISPRPLNFDLKYIPEGKDWKLIYIQVDTK